MRSDDLVPLLTQGPGPGLRFHAGLVETWNAETGANTISVAGATLVDVPILNTGESIALKAGHTVGLLAWQSSYWILGRITAPGDPQFAGAAVSFAGAGQTATGFGLSTTYTPVVSGTLTVPAWADEAIVLAVGNATVQSDAAGGDFAYLRVYVDGVPGGSMAAWVEPGLPGPITGTITASAQRLITAPAATIALEVRMRGTSYTWPAMAGNGAHLDAIALFRATT